jgi:hypothetical protein
VVGTVRVRVVAAALAVVLTTACIDFVEPNLPRDPDLDSAAVLDVRIIVSDSGRVSTDATLLPGLDSEGVRRRLAYDHLEIMGRFLEPDSVRPDGTLRYLGSHETGISPVREPIVLLAPGVEGVAAPPPAIEWFGLERLGPESVPLTLGEDLILRVAPVAGTSRPTPTTRQWFLTLSSDSGVFRLSSDGFPPDSIVVPPHWVPPGDTVHVRLIFSQSTTLSDPPGDYLGLIAIDTWLFWTVAVSPP